MNERKLFQKALRALINIIVLISFAWFLVYALLSQTVVSGYSMEPTLSANDMVLTDLMIYHIIPPRRFDVISFYRNDGTVNVKRIVGLPGETVLIQNQKIFINGKELEAPEISDITLPGIAENPVTLPKEEYFVIGDNANSSEDSRFENVGNVRRNQIVGKLWFRISPIQELRLIR